MPVASIPTTLNQSAASTIVSGSELLKRKTLKSIKRYRQTKQNTEPCNNNQQQNMSIDEIDSNQLYNQYYSNNEQILNDYSNNKQKQQLSPPLTNNNNNNISLSSTSSSSGSGATNTSGYGTLLQHQASLNNNHSQKKDGKQPLKSCLKRKDSQSSSQSQTSSKASANSPMVNKRSHSTTKPTTTTNCAADIFNQSKCTLMFVPSVGYLFTYDRQSAQRYSYYNKLERCRRVRVYRELINEELDEEDEEEGDEDEAAKNASEQCQQGVSASRSDNDLRVKKSVTFLAHVVEHKQTHLRANSSGESSSTSSSAMTTPTAASPYHKPSAVASEAPLLQYNALIAMLKSNSQQSRQSKEEARSYPVNSQVCNIVYG